jgi:D-aminopeptidase
MGVLVQTNFGGVLQVNGLPLGQILGPPGQTQAPSGDGSCLIVVATDAPLDSRNLKRLAKRGLLGIARTGGFYSNGSGDYAIALSTAVEVRISQRSKSATQTVTLLRDDRLTPLFQAAAEAAEEAILNSLFKAVGMEGFEGHVAEALPLDKVRELLIIKGPK